MVPMNSTSMGDMMNSTAMGDMMNSTSMGDMMNRTAMGDMKMNKTMMTHMTFFWGTSTEIFFSGWPGQSSGMYAVALALVFGLSMLVEWLSHTRFIKSTTNKLVAGLLQTAMYGLRVGLAYLVMLAVMSFNVGVFLAAIAGYTTGFLLFGSRVFRDSSDMLPYEKASDLPPLNC
ncbi:Copper transporter 1 [Vitis vinifera]|uniref:Copper transport protein n=1 Tax=Vitis vinifera TaxID=29760 RepID=A0A438F9J3_VITVI|nr:Copper transporter 1 [Vitis vinifera]RVW65867.1 Copper transporter 1 [Vitis vinifera]